MLDHMSRERILRAERNQTLTFRMLNHEREMSLQAELEEEEVDQLMALKRNRFEALDLQEQGTKDWKVPVQEEWELYGRLAEDDADLMDHRLGDVVL
jgi:hypothetical protein